MSRWRVREGFFKGAGVYVAEIKRPEDEKPAIFRVEVDKNGEFDWDFDGNFPMGAFARAGGREE